MSPNNPNEIPYEDPNKYKILKPKEEYERLINIAADNFIEEFKHKIPVKISEIKKIHKWQVNKNSLNLLRNFITTSFQKALEMENLNIQSDETQKILKEFEERLALAKEDIKYINDEVEKKVDDEMRGA